MSTPYRHQVDTPCSSSGHSALEPVRKAKDGVGGVSKAEPADAAAIADASEAEPLIFPDLKAMRPEDPLLSFLATLGIEGKQADAWPAEDSADSDEEDARKLSLFDGMTPVDTTRLWRHWESRASEPMTAPADDKAEHSAR